MANDPAAAAAAATTAASDSQEAAAAAAQRGGGFQQLIGAVVRAAIVYYGFSYVVNLAKGGPGAPTSADTASSRPAADSFSASIPHTNSWSPGMKFSLQVYTSESPFFSAHNSKILWKEKNLKYSWSGENNREKNISFPCSNYMKSNGTIFAHIFLKPTSPTFANRKIVKTIPLNVYAPRPRLNTKQNLMSGEYSDADVASAVQENRLEELQKERDSNDEWISLWRPLLHIRPLLDSTSFPVGKIPGPIRSEYSIDFQTNQYTPPLYIDYFWLLRDRFIAINDTISELPLELKFSPISMMKWQLQSRMEESLAQQLNWGSTQEDTESLRRMLLETNPWLLVLTMVVSLLHTVFDVLAFKNDIQFWKENKSMKGLSVRTIFVNCICQFIIFLYLLDNDTSWMILLSSGVGFLIECWKIAKAVNVHFERPEGGGIPRIRFEDKESYVDNDTAEHDRQAMKYLSYVSYPLVIGYAIYSLWYNEHKGWYSWILSSLVGCVYTFGFIMMCPQLYLNYKLKSVAHLPWRMLTYKALNTFIDDLFAFIITMPTMHRLSCFRDDIVFFVYLYQRWIYRTDYSRANEFGLIPDQDSLKKNDDAAASASSDAVEEAKESGVTEEPSEQVVSETKTAVLKKRHNAKSSNRKAE